jgi:hypothetical protein
MRSTSSGPTDQPPASDGDPATDDVDHDIWVPAQHAAIALAKPERWLREECKAGQLPCHGEPDTGQVFLVPMNATEELAERTSTTDP